jgi:hypothetical protein
MTTTLFLCGDIVNYNNSTGHICSPALQAIIASCDYSIANFEAPISGVGSPQRKSGIHHSQRRETIRGLKEQGFDLLLLANNHTMDYGRDGLQATMDLASQVGLDVTGAGFSESEAYTPLIKSINGITVGIINVCESQFGVLDYYPRQDSSGYAWIHHRKVDLLILELKRKCDFVIVCAHAGLEHYSVPQKEWRERYRQFCDLGADLVVGSHPHVPQGYEEYGDSWIFYSLGNFYFDSERYKDRADQTFSIRLFLTKDKKIRFEPIYHHKRGEQVYLSSDEEKIDISYLNRLLGEDYMANLDAMSREAYPMIKRNLLLSLSDFPCDGDFTLTLLKTIKRKIMELIGRREKIDRKLIQLHFLRNESYYYAAKYALEIMNR